jgi:hypothetical protein
MTVVWDSSGTTPRVAREKNVVMSTVGLGTKNDWRGPAATYLTLPD